MSDRRREEVQVLKDRLSGVDVTTLAEVPDSGLADSGLRHTFEGGAQREMAPGKGRYDLLSPLATRRLAVIMERGAAKYQARNWEHGLPLSSFINSAKRHLDQGLAGETDEDHFGQALWNVHCLVHTQEMVERGLLPAELDDLPNYVGDARGAEVRENFGPSR